MKMKRFKVFFFMENKQSYNVLIYGVEMLAVSSQVRADLKEEIAEFIDAETGFVLLVSSKYVQGVSISIAERNDNETS